MGKLKRHEFYTAALGAVLHLVLGCHFLYANREQETDPNYYDDCDFKITLGKILSETKIGLVVDIHGTGNEKPEVCFRAWGREESFFSRFPMFLICFIRLPRNMESRPEGLIYSPRQRQMTVAKFAAKRFSVPAIQVEISDRMRMPWRREEEFRRLIGFLLGFIEKVISEKTS